MATQEIDKTLNFLEDYLSVSFQYIQKEKMNFSQVINHQYNAKSEFKEFRVKIYNQILTDFGKQKQMFLNNCNTLHDLFYKDFIDNYNSIKEENRQDSHFFNVFQFFSIGETMHSYLLSRLLNPYLEHGQGLLFLKLFLKKIVEVNESDHWIITVEKGRVDVLLKRIDPPSVIIIENKSNNAGDQENQLYRYWYKEIYEPNCHRNDVIEYTSKNPNYRIIYLVPNDWKTPSENSLIKPKGEGYGKSAPEKIPMTPLLWNYKKEIVCWLSTSLLEIPKRNYRLKEYVKQYIDLISLMK